MKIFIKNRKDQKVAVIVEESENQQGLVFVMHGLSGNKEEAQIINSVDAFRERGFTTVKFDTTNTFGESDGEYENATITNYYEDLEDVIEWAKTQSWYLEPFWLVGHSLGGICTALYAEKHPEKVNALAPISTVVSNTLIPDKYNDEVLKKWKKIGYLNIPRTSMPGTFKKLNWTFFEDRLKYDLLENANKLTMPTLLIVGEKDTSTPLAHQQILFDALPDKKELHIIKGSEHTFHEQKYLDEVRDILTKWIDENL